jgi:hypothetical protein
MATSKSRRGFLADSVAGLGSVWLAAHWPAILEAEEYAQRDAMASQIFPATDTPGAHEAHIINFIDRALVTFARDRRPVYIQGLKDLQSKTKELFPTASKFSALTSAQQIQLLTAIEKTPFFLTVREHTLTGMFASPKHGGNFNKAGWKLIGFEDTLNFKPPFGYYDAAALKSGK